MLSTARREPLPDALRALALAGVLLVNAAGYLSAPSGAILGEWSASAGASVQWLQGLYAFAVQGKAYPVLAFLFGMGLWLATRHGDRRAALARARRRQYALLGLGLAHGLFLYFGDILTAYAIVGGLVLRHVHEPWRLLRRRLWRGLGWMLGVLILVALIALAALLSGGFDPGDGAAPAGFADAQTYPAFLLLNVDAYLWLQGSMLVLGLPLLRLCMLGGVAAGRLRLLTHPRWRGGLQRWALRWAAPAGLLNAAYAAVYVALQGQREWLGLLEVLGMMSSPLLSAVLVAVVALYAGPGRDTWLRRLAPLGQRTLTLYVGHSLLCLLLFSGVGLGLRPGLWGLLGFSVSLWALAWAAAAASGTRRWPLEAWLARR